LGVLQNAATGKEKTQLKTEEKAKILAWHENRLSSRKITTRLGRDQSTIVRVV
jgi:IS30 family transposase